MSTSINQNNATVAEKHTLHKLYVSTKEAAEILGLAPGTLGNFAWKKVGPKHYVVNRRRLYAIRDLEDYVKQNPVVTIDQC
ncbi:MAG: helix-turn-helix domain-containing protein [Smithella sp.]